VLIVALPLVPNFDIITSLEFVFSRLKHCREESAVYVGVMFVLNDEVLNEHAFGVLTEMNIVYI